MAQQVGETGSGKPGFPECFENALGDMDQARELPYRPAAAQRRINRPDRWQHPTAFRSYPEAFPCQLVGGHRWKAAAPRA